MISILFGGTLEDPDVKKWLKRHSRLAQLLRAQDPMVPYMRGVLRSIQTLTYQDPVTGKVSREGVANDPIIVHFDDLYLVEFKNAGEDGIRCGFARLAGFIEPAISLGLNLRVVVFNKHHDLMDWLEGGKRWPAHWPKPIFTP